MHTLTQSIISPRVLYFGLAMGLTLVSGLVLSFLGRPLNSLVFAVHKLSAVGAILLIGLAVRTQFKAGGVPTLVLVVLGVAILLILGLVVSGALLSFERAVPQSPLRMHQILPLLALGASIGGMVLLAGSES